MLVAFICSLALTDVSHWALQCADLAWQCQPCRLLGSCPPVHFSQNAHLRPLQLVGLQRSHVQVAGLATLPLHLLRYWPACPLRDRRRQLRQLPSTRPRLVGGFWAYRWWGCSCQLGLGPVCARAFFSYFLIVQLLGGLGWLHMHAFPCTQGSLRTQERLLRCQATFWAGLRHPQHHGHMLRSQQQRSHTLRPR